MKKLSIYIVALLVIAVVAAGVYYPKLAAKHRLDNDEVKEEVIEYSPITNTAPDFEVFDEAGNSVHLSNYFGKPIVINYWTTWCQHCAKEILLFETISEEYAARVTFLFVDNTDGIRETIDGVKAFLLENGFSITTFYDTQSSAIAAYGVRGYPTSVFIDQDGNPYGIYTGEIDEETLRYYLSGLLGESAEA